MGPDRVISKLGHLNFDVVAQLSDSVFREQTIQYNLDLFLVGILLAGCPLYVFDDLLARVFVVFLILNASVVTMRQKRFLFKLPSSARQTLTSGN